MDALRIPCSEGASENSPAFQRRVGEGENQVLKGTAENHRKERKEHKDQTVFSLCSLRSLRFEIWPYGFEAGWLLVAARWE
jgi:hypothetical protein